MKTIFLALLFGGLLVTQGFAADEAGKKISKSFNVASGGELTVEADLGDIQVSGGNQDTMEVVIERQVIGASESREAGALKSQKVRMAQDGNNVRVEVGSPKSRSLSSRVRPELTVQIRITLPKRFNANLTTSSGSIEVSGLRGMVDAHTLGGDLSFAKIEGTVEGHTSGGNVRAEGCTDKLLAQTSGGSIVIKKFTGSSATADSSGGNVEVAGCEGKLQVKTSGGNITIGDFNGEGVFADTAGGGIMFDLAKQPEIECHLHSGGGNITARLAEGVGVNLNALTDGGSVITAMQVSESAPGRIIAGHLEGKINVGGPLLMLRTRGGNIEVLKR